MFRIITIPKESFRVISEVPGESFTQITYGKETVLNTYYNDNGFLISTPIILAGGGIGVFKIGSTFKIG